MALSTSTSIVVNVTGTDANGVTVQSTTTVASVQNAGSTYFQATTVALVAGLNVIQTNASAIGCKMMTVVPPTNNTASINIGSNLANSQSVTATLPFTLGVAGVGPVSLWIGATAGFTCTLIFS